MGIKDSVLAFLRASRTPSGRLARMEGLVVITAGMLLLMSFLDPLRRRTSRRVLWGILNGVSTNVITYITALIQSATFKNELLLMWVVLLTCLKESTDNIAAYGIDQEQNRRTKEMKELMQLFWVAYLIATQVTTFKYPLWLLLVLSILRNLQRIICFQVASKSYGVGKNSMLITDYMKYEHERTTGLDQVVNPSDMRGYKYFVLGEDRQKVEPGIPEYLLTVTDENKFITLEKIWGCEGNLLAGSGGDTELKDVCLSFAMYKLLRPRFDNLNLLPETENQKKNNLVLHGLVSEEDGDYERPFRVIDKELAFLNDYFYTRYPIIFSTGFPIWYIALSFMVAVTCLIYVAILKNINLHHPEGHLFYTVQGVDVAKIITFFLLIVIIVKEIWEVITCILSDWAKVVLLCKYVEKPSWRSYAYEKVIGYLCRQQLAKPRQLKIGQYSFLAAFNFKPLCFPWKLSWTLFVSTRHLVPRRNLIKVPDGVKKAVLSSLRSLRTSKGRPTNGRSSLQKNGFSEKLSWACLAESNTHSIIVWHIATSLCEIELSRKMEYKPKTAKRRFVRALLRFRSFDNLGDELQNNYEIAASLSRYCAFLVAYNPDMLPDPESKVGMIFDNAVSEAKELLEGHRSMESKYRKMMEVKEPFKTITEKGVKLGKQLIQDIESDQTRWQVLADFWAEFMLYTAASMRKIPDRHALSGHVEFVIHLWALLSHAGLEIQYETEGKSEGRTGRLEDEGESSQSGSPKAEVETAHQYEASKNEGEIQHQGNKKHQAGDPKAEGETEQTLVEPEDLNTLSDARAPQVTLVPLPRRDVQLAVLHGKTPGIVPPLS